MTTTAMLIRNGTHTTLLLLLLLHLLLLPIHEWSSLSVIHRIVAPSLAL
jgi:hypothetical protein